MTTNITEEHRNAFHVLTSVDYDNFLLFSWFVYGTLDAAIELKSRALGPAH